jgi:acyl dehydratase
MALDYEKLLRWEKNGVSREYTARDTILYALASGVGLDAGDSDYLKFVYEKDLQALPTMASVLGNPWGWVYEANAGVNRLKHVVGEHAITFHKPLPVAGRVHTDSRIKSIVDKGADKGALLYTERKLYDAAGGDLLCTLDTTMFCRADGGFGGPAGPLRVPAPIPDRVADLVCDLPTSRQAALLYRLWGDGNPLHVDPAVGRAAGFNGPILHGLATFSAVGYAVLRLCYGADPARLASIEARFSAPVYPGDLIRVELWRDGGNTAFRAGVPARNATVINHGRAAGVAAH